MYIKDQKNRKTINEYAGLITKIRNEYAQIQKENNQLRIEIKNINNIFNIIKIFQENTESKICKS